MATVQWASLTPPCASYDVDDVGIFYMPQSVSGVVTAPDYFGCLPVFHSISTTRDRSPIVVSFFTPLHEDVLGLGSCI